MLIEAKVVDGEIYVPLDTVGEIVKAVWPFPPSTGAIPWTAEQIKKHAKNHIQELGDALW